MSSYVAEAHGHSVPVQALELGKAQKVAYTGTAGTTTDAITAGTSVVRVTLTSAGFVKIAPSPTATTDDHYMPADVPEYLKVPAGAACKVSAIQLSSGGTLMVSECLGVVE